MAEIVGIVTSLVGPAIELGKCVVVPIKRRFNYLCCFNSNIQNLRDEAKNFEDARDGLQMRVTRAKNNAEELVPEVETWLEKANEIQVNIIGIESEISNTQRSWLTVKSRYSLSKRVTKTTEAMKKLRDCCNFNVISLPAPPAALASVPSGPVHELESRKRVEEDIMITLRAKNVNMIGICGMGGVGKTTMAKKIWNKVKEEGIFDEVVMATVSQQVDTLKIQREIAELLGLKFEVESLSARAHLLRSRLMAKKRILVILDDLWEKLKLEDLGIPYESDSKGCTILLTSRNRDVFEAMDVEKIFELQTLSDIEAWSLFKEKVGSCADDQSLHSIAQEIAKECKGLPIALVTVGVALKNKRSESIWKDGLQQLKSSNLTNTWDFVAEAYNPLKLSYDLLDNKQARFIFLLCCLFPEDYNINTDYLIYYGWGLGIFEGVGNLEQARNRLCTLVEMLKSRFLLLDISSESYVKMHDIVRDVAIFIASEAGLIEPNLSSEMRLPEQYGSNCTWISSFHLGEGTELPRGLVYPNLRLLLIDNSAKGKIRIHDNFFQGKRKLNVLFMRFDPLKSLPHTTRLLKSLRTLILDSCRSLRTISVVAELVSLEIVICEYCHSIEELPVEIGRLNRLKVLVFSRCNKLKTIAPGVISNLVGLEVLTMSESFDRWEAAGDRGEERKNAALSELQSLSNLTYLNIEIGDSTLAAEEIHLSSNLEGYNIKIGAFTRIHETNHQRKMHLEMKREIKVANWIEKLMKSTEYLYLEGDGTANFCLSEFENLKWLALTECSMVKRVVNETTAMSGRSGTNAVFPLLECLRLKRLANLEEICDTDGPISSNSFKNLRELELTELPALKQLCRSRYQNNVVSLFSNLSSIWVESCGSLHNLFSLARTEDHCLSQLEALAVWDCEMMEEAVFLRNEGEENKNDRENHRTTIFPKLKWLILMNLPGLTNFCKGIEGIEFPLLFEMEILSCPQLKSFVSTDSFGNTEKGQEGINHDHDDHDSSHLFCNSKVAFGCLKELDIDDRDASTLWCHQTPMDFLSRLERLKIGSCGNIRILFSSPIAANFVNLKRLLICDCPEIVKVIEEEKDAGTTCLFPNLEFLYLNNLPKLKCFCEWRCTLELPSLEKVDISKCFQMGRFNLGSLITPNLQRIRINEKDIVNAKDLNGALQQQ